MARSNSLNLASCAFWSFALSVALLPIGLGGDRPLSFGLVQMGLAFSSLFLAADTEIWRDIRFFPRLRWALELFCIVLFWAFFQILPFAPQSWIHPLWQEAAGVLKIPVHGSIAIDPESAVKGATRLITYIATGLLAYVLSQDPKRARKLLKVIWFSGVVICFYGMIVYAARSNTILWYQKWAYIGDLTATFVNRNDFAIYAGMVLVTGMALLVQSWSRKVKNRKPHRRIEAFREWITKTGIPQCFLMGLVLLDIAFSHSRAGFTLTLLGLAGYIFFYQVYLHAWHRAALIGVLALIGIVIAICVAFQFSDRFAVLLTDHSSLDRLKVYKLGLRALQDNPWFGYGLNGFEPEFRLYQQNMLMEFNHAHSDILESLIDLGIPVALLLWAAIGLLLSCLWNGIIRRRQNGMFPVLALTSSLMILMHACIDFSLQIPGDVMTWAALLGAGLAQSWPQADRTGRFS